MDLLMRMMEITNMSDMGSEDSDIESELGLSDEYTESDVDEGEANRTSDSLEEEFADILKVPRTIVDLRKVQEAPSADTLPASEKAQKTKEVLEDPAEDDSDLGETFRTEFSTEEEEEECGGAKRKKCTGTSVNINQKKNGDNEEKLHLSESAFKIGKNNLPIQLSKGLEDMATMLRHHAEKKEIYAVQPYEGGRRSARITLKEDKLCLHRLRKKHPPPGSFTVYHSDVMKLVNPESRLTFLELCEDFCFNFGVVYIRLAGDTRGAMQFAYLCTGEKGPSYAGHGAVGLFNSKDKKLEYVRMGDYEHDDGTGGRALVTDLKDDNKKDYIRPWVAGTLEGGWVWGNDMASQFDILMKDNPGRFCEAAFGIVEEGFEKLQQGVTTCRGCIESLIICDCGIVLPF